VLNLYLILIGYLPLSARTAIIEASSMYSTILLVSFGLTWAQQLSDFQIYMGYPGLSSSCEQALNTSVSCPAFLSSVSVRGGTLDTDEVTALCSDTCYSSLGSARDTIKGACIVSTDVIVYNDQAYSATFIVDNFIYTYSLSCRKDSKTGQFCDPQILAWSNQTQLTSAQSCSDCWLGVQAMELGSPLGYNDDLASNFASLTSSCSASGYAFTSFTAYALNSTAIDVPSSATATSPQTCTNSYIVQVIDNCNSIAKAHNVSTFNLLYDNSLDLYCKNFAAAVGTSLCIPLQCDTYTWQALNSCSSVVSRFTGMTIPQFLAWNPNFNSLCQNTLNFVGNEVCVGYVPSLCIKGQNHTDQTPTQAPRWLYRFQNKQYCHPNDCGDGCGASTYQCYGWVK